MNKIAMLGLIGLMVTFGDAAFAAQGKGQSTDAPGEKARERAMEQAPDTGERVTSRNETSQEMQARREERKEIQEEHREAREAGEASPAGKKPWWKFWGDD